MMNYIGLCLGQRQDIYSQILRNPTFEDDVSKLYALIKSTLLSGGKLLFCGNGGSAADGQHIAAEFIGRLTKERDSWPAVSLSSNSSILTCLANDYDYENVFCRQIAALGTVNDLLIALTTSGNSKNVISAICSAQAKGIPAIAITGQHGGCCERCAQRIFRIPSSNTQVVQELTVMLFHIICEALENDAEI